MERVYLGKQSVTGNMIYQEFVCVKISKMYTAKYCGMMNDGNLELKELRPISSKLFVHFMNNIFS